MAKYGMSMCVLGMSEEFRDEGVAVNALWPRTGNSQKIMRNIHILYYQNESLFGFPTPVVIKCYHWSGPLHPFPMMT